jgi:hypothetical protein
MLMLFVAFLLVRIGIDPRGLNESVQVDLVEEISGGWHQMRGHVSEG